MYAILVTCTGDRCGGKGRCIGWTVLHWIHSCVHDGSWLWRLAGYVSKML